MTDYARTPTPPEGPLKGTGDIEAALIAGMTMAQPQVSDGVSFVVVPKGATVERFDGEHLLDAPRRTRGTVVAADMAGFKDYFNRFSDEDSMIFADPAALKFVGILDYHVGIDTDGVAPRWCAHRVEYSCPLSKEWQTWTQNHNQKKAQVAFAQFVEDNVDDITDPPGAEMLSIAKAFQAKKNASFSSDIRLDNGQVQLNYTEEIRGTATQGAAEIPELFTLGIPVFYGGTRYKVRARLRYRIENGHLELWYSLINQHKMVDDAFNTAYLEIGQATQAPILKGAPPASVTGK